LNSIEEEVPLLTMQFITRYVHQIDIEFPSRLKDSNILSGRQGKQDESNQRGSKLDSDICTFKFTIIAMEETSQMKKINLKIFGISE